jgi:phosphoglycolate phosphatase
MIMGVGAMDGIRVMTGSGGTIMAVLLDKDGTLIDHEQSWTPLHRAAAASVARMAGDRPGLAARLFAAGTTPGPDGVSVFAAGTAFDVAVLWAPLCGLSRQVLEPVVDGIFSTSAAVAVAIPGAEAAIRGLHRAGYAIGIASNDSARAVEALARRWRLEDMVKFTAGYDSGHGAKPNPGMALAFAAATGCRPGVVAVVGDSLLDLAMARAAGAGLAIAVLSGAEDRGALAPVADAVLGSVADLPGFLGVAAAVGETA